METSGKVMQRQGLMFLTRSIRFHPTAVTSGKGLTHSVQVNCIVLSKVQQNEC